VLTSLGSSATVNLVVVANDNSNLDAAKAAAAAADVTIVMAGVVTSEGRDRPDLSLPNDQDALIAGIAAAAPGKTVLVLKDGDPVLMPWINQVPALLEAWNPGEEDGNIVANLLFGVANPSGKLPVTYPKLASDTPTSTPDRYPGITVDGFPTVDYSEGLQMGYRWYDAQNIAPQFAFGHGLSYTTFAISKLEATPKKSDGTHPILVQFFVENTGKRAGAEVAQVYLGLPTATGEPPKRLVAFQKVWLQPGEKRKVKLTIDPEATSHPLGIFDSAAQQWTIADGNYNVYVGNASDNIVLSDAVTVRTPGKP
jgi:beta-glucosidase